MSKHSVHMWKLMSGLGREQSHSGPLEKDSAAHRWRGKGRKKRGDQKYHSDIQNKSKLPPCTHPAGLFIAQSQSG